MLRLLLPKVLLPATTALGTIASDGRERGLLAGANVVMPNLSPKNVREKYLLYDNKIHTDEEAAESKEMLEAKVKSIGYNIVTSRGDAKR
jgi:biotin synthase